MSKLTCIIIEDEKPAQEVLKAFIAKTEWINLLGVFGDAISAIDYLKRNDVDFIFLDIQIPGITGLDFLKIGTDTPQVIITTAYSEYAVEAFELDVRDYLMKPFSFERFLKAINRITVLPEPSQVHRFEEVLSERSFAFFNVNKVMVKIQFEDILYVESMREYVYIHLPDRKVITKMSMTKIEKVLFKTFIRVHRSFLVNKNKITAYTAEDVLIDKISVPIGINYKKIVESLLTAL